jgi:hypothetical protein
MSAAGVFPVSMAGVDLGNFPAVLDGAFEVVMVWISTVELPNRLVCAA